MLKIEVIRWKIDSEVDKIGKFQIFTFGRNADFERLQPTPNIWEQNLDPLPTERNIRLQEMLRTAMEENVEVFDHHLESHLRRNEGAYAYVNLQQSIEWFVKCEWYVLYFRA